MWIKTISSIKLKSDQNTTTLTHSRCLKKLKMKKTKFTFLIAITISFYFFLFYTYVSIKLYREHGTRGDLTNFAQAMWNTTQGRIMQNTFNYSIHNFWGQDTREREIPNDSNIFGIHFNPLLFLFVPFYAIYPNPKTLLIIQAFFTSAAGFLVFLLARLKLKKISLSFILTFSFFMYIGVFSSVLNEFHASTLSIFFGLLFIYFYEVGRIKSFLISLMMFLFIQENTAIAAAVFGIYLLIFKKQRILGLFITVLSVVYFIVVTKLAIPYFSNYKGYIFESVYGNTLGTNFIEIFQNSITDPQKFIKTIFNNLNLRYVFRLILPVSPFILFSPILLLISLLSVFANLISSSLPLKSSNLHYDAIAVPFIYYATIVGLKNFREIILSRVKVYSSTLLFVCSLLLLILAFSQYLFIKHPKINRKILLENNYSKINLELDSLIKRIPTESSVSTQDYISGHLTNRRGLYLFPVYYNKVDYLILSTEKITWPLAKEEHIKYLEDILSNSSYQIEYKSDNYILIKKIIE